MWDNICATCAAQHAGIASQCFCELVRYDAIVLVVLVGAILWSRGFADEDLGFEVGEEASGVLDWRLGTSAPGIGVEEALAAGGLCQQRLL